MLTRFSVRMAFIAMIVTVAALMGGCAGMGKIFTKAPPAADESWSDVAGGIPQR